MSQQHSVFKKVRFALEYAGVRIMLWLASLLPLRFTSACGAVIGWLAWEVIRVRRSLATNNIMHALALDASRAAEIGRRAYMNTGRSFMELSAFGRITQDDVRRMVRLEGRETIDEVRSLGKGAIVYLGHFGNWDILGATFRANGYGFSAVVGTQSNARVDRLINDMRRVHMGVIPQESRGRTIIRSLHRGEFVALVADQDAGRSGVFVEFLGRRASAHRGPAAIAVSQGCPIVFNFIHRLPGPRFVSHYIGPLWPDPGLEGEEAIAELTQRLHDHLAHAIKQYPEEYFWGHRRWKTRPPEEAD